MPLLSIVGFVQLSLYDGATDGIGSTVYVNLRTDSITGAVLGSTAPVFMPDNFGRGTNAVVTFPFGAPVTVTSGTVYYVQPVVQSGEDFGVAYYNTFNYANGTAYYRGAADPFFDLWFREGIVVPEPSSALLLVLGGGLAVWRRRR
jgi:hypothetical protein